MEETTTVKYKPVGIAMPCGLIIKLTNTGNKTMCVSSLSAALSTRRETDHRYYINNLCALLSLRLLAYYEAQYAVSLLLHCDTVYKRRYVDVSLTSKNHVCTKLIFRGMAVA